MKRERAVDRLGLTLCQVESMGPGIGPLIPSAWFRSIVVMRAPIKRSSSSATGSARALDEAANERNAVLVAPHQTEIESRMLVRQWNAHYVRR